MTVTAVRWIGISLLLSACQASGGAGRLHYTSAAREGGPPFPSPLIHGSVGGRRSQIVVDTGAQATVVLGWLAREAGLATNDVIVEGADPSGQPLKFLQTERPRIELDGFGRIDDRPTLVIDMPPFFEQAGIGAIVSPQSIARPGEALVIDLIAGELRREPIASAEQRIEHLPIVLSSDRTRVCVSDAGSVQARIVVTPALLNGHATVVELDTGASQTMFVDGSTAGRSLASFTKLEENTVVGAAGTIQMTKYGDVPLEIGGLTTKTAVSLIPGAAHPTCGYEGRIGIDLLKRCVLVVGEARVLAGCRR